MNSTNSHPGCAARTESVRRRYGCCTPALGRAIEHALARFVAAYPLWVDSLFDQHFLRRRAACILAAYANGELDQAAAVHGLTTAWARQFGDPCTARRRRRQAELAPAAGEFLAWFDDALARREQVNLPRRLLMALRSA